MLEPDNQKSRAVERLRERFRENPERAYNVTPLREQLNAISKSQA